MGRKPNGKGRDILIDNISLGFASALGIAGVIAGTFIPSSVLPVAAIQAGAYCPAIVAAVVKGSISRKEFSKKIEGQINSCAEITSKECLAELKKNNPTMYSLFLSTWENDTIYDQNSTMECIEQNMKDFLIKEVKREGYEITPMEINEVVNSFIQRFFINARDYPELNQAILLGVYRKIEKLEERQDVLEEKVEEMSASNEKDIRAFYEHIDSEFKKTPKSTLYGKISLDDGYIEPTIEVEGTKQSVSEFLGQWVGGTSTIMVISGEPGQGKTSLCWKAMCDFWNNGWLTDKVDNVFCFSLNPAKTDALSNDSFYLFSLLSWGNERKKQEHILNLSDCKNALVFFDGFDELLEWYPSLSLKRFIADEILPFQEETGAHIVITSRDMAIEPDIGSCFQSDEVDIQIFRLQLISKSQQLNWIKSYIEKCRDTSPPKAAELEKYLERYQNISENYDMDSILGIPIIFRMLVEAHYLPEESPSIPCIYDELFHITWTRHNKKIGSEDELSIKKRLKNLSLRIFIDDNDTAEIENGSLSPWLFSFYTSHEGKKRVGFFHRSFYQYFLAHEILSWYIDYAEGKDEDLIKDHLSYLARRKLDRTTIKYIKELYDCCCDKESLQDAFDKAYTILKETDGFLPLPSNEDDAYKIKSKKQIVRANNIFLNIVSIGSSCGQKVSLEKINIEALQVYDLSGCNLSDAILEGAHLQGARLSGVNLSGANLYGAILQAASLDGANLSEADLSEADLSRADLSRAFLRNASLIRANLRRANFSAVTLYEATLSRADFSNVDFFLADLEGVDLSSEDLSGVCLHKANLRGASLIGTNFSNADFRQADLRGASLISANFFNADLSGADLSDTDVTGANLKMINLNNAIISNLTIDRTSMEKKVAYHLQRAGCDISRARIFD